MNESLITKIKAWENPYPKDIFSWDNKEKIDLNRGRFNQFIFQVVENTREKIIEIIEEDNESDK